MTAQPLNRSTAQPLNRTTAQPYNRTTAQPYNRTIMLQLLRHALCDGAVDVDAIRAIQSGSDRIDWMKVLEEASVQTVLGMVWGVIEHTPELASMMMLNEKLEYYGHNRLIVERNKVVNKTLSSIVRVLDKEGINSVLLKGQGCASFYPYPLYRIAGDIDLLVGKQNFHKAQQCLQQAGLVGEWLREDMVHGELTSNGVTLELHKFAAILPGKKHDRLFQNEVLGCLNENYKECPRITIDDTSIAILPVELNVVFTFIHMFRHFIASGILLRQVCDWLLMLRHICASSNKASSVQLIERYLIDFGYLNAWKVFAQMAVECLTIPEEQVPLYEKGYSNHAQKVMNVLIEHDIRVTKINRKNIIKGCWDMLFFYKSYFRNFRIFPKECLCLLSAIMKINIQKNLLRKL